MRILAVILLLIASSLAGAAEQRRFAVLSLIGDRLLVAQYFPVTGFQSEQGVQAFVQLDDNSLDKTVLQAADGALKGVDRAIKPVLLVAKDNSLYAAQDNLMNTNQSSKLLLEPITPMLRGSGSTHLILITKLRADARVQQLKDAYMGSGQLEGVGFYVDAGRATPATATAPGLAGTPVLGPFAYFKLELIDLSKGEIVKEERVTASQTYANPGSNNAWGTLTTPEKINALQTILRREVAKAVPVLLGAPRLN
jgi:hypothetical protein